MRFPFLKRRRKNSGPSEPPVAKVEEKKYPHYESMVVKRETGHPLVRKFLGRWALAPDRELPMSTLAVVVSAMEILIAELPKPEAKNELAVLRQQVDILSTALREVVGDKESEYAVMGTDMPTEVRYMVDRAKRGLEESDAAAER